MNRYLVYKSAFRLSGPSKFKCINMEAYVKPKTFDIEKEVIIFSVGTIEKGYQITLKGKEVTSLRHKRWLKSILEENINTSSLQTTADYP